MCVAGEPHRLHHGFGAGHVERDLVHAGQFGQPLHIVGNDRMIQAEHRAERLRAPLGGGDALLVEVVAEDVDAVGAGEVIELIAVEVGQRDAGRGLHERAGAELLLDQPAVLERHAVGLGELQVGDAACRLRGERAALGEFLLEQRAEAEEAVLASSGDLPRRAIGAEEVVDFELITRDQLGDPARHLGMAGERAVLGTRQLDAGLDLRGDGGRHGSANRQRYIRNRVFHHAQKR